MSIPPASLEMLVLSLKFQAEQGLGLVQPDPAQADLALARHAIDLLAVLQEKTRGNLNLAESRLLEGSLAELRFCYTQASRIKEFPAAAKTRAAAAG